MSWRATAFKVLDDFVKVLGTWETVGLITFVVTLALIFDTRAIEHGIAVSKKLFVQKRRRFNEWLKKTKYNGVPFWLLRATATNKSRF